MTGGSPAGSDPALSWREQLAALAIPQEILDAAPESPWGFPVDLFSRRADAASEVRTPSTEAALAALPEGGTVLDVGCGAGAATVPLLGRAGRAVGVDPSAAMLDAFRDRVRERGVEVSTFEAEWSEAAAEVPPADVAVCHHVLYNVPDLLGFIVALTEHARHRVVVELSERHPLSWLTPLWQRFHGLGRPDGPAADDALAVVRQAGCRPEQARWTAPPASFPERAELVAWVRRRLCLPPDRDPEIDAALEEVVPRAGPAVGFPPRATVSAWWEGTAN